LEQVNCSRLSGIDIGAPQAEQLSLINFIGLSQ
jgi:hypothetical protein